MRYLCSEIACVLAWPCSHVSSMPVIAGFSEQRNLAELFAEYFPDKRKQPLSSITAPSDHVLLLEYARLLMISLRTMLQFETSLASGFGCAPATFAPPFPTAAHRAFHGQQV